MRFDVEGKTESEVRVVKARRGHVVLEIQDRQHFVREGEMFTVTAHFRHSQTLGEPGTKIKD